MPSRAAVEFYRARDRARILISASTHPSPNTLKSTHKTSCLHAALAGLVAAWEAYLERLVRESQSVIADPTNLKLAGVLALLQPITELSVKAFNTPNADNARKLLLSHTGYDPINDWQWPAKGISGIQTRQRLDEILAIRHSFAHGFPIPTNIPWATSYKTAGRLNVSVLNSVDSFISHLVKVTDTGMAGHLSSKFSLKLAW